MLILLQMLMYHVLPLIIMGKVDEIGSSIFLIFIIIFGFFVFLPELANVTGTSLIWPYLLGAVLLITVLLPLFRR
jgi:divalent metal cation (Fe/Co/Zn/Cd) transporter